MPPTATLAADLPVVMSARVVCRLAADSPNAIAAQITGVDGTQTAVVGDTAWWFFGDTVRRSASGQDVIPAAVATSTDSDASDCIDLRFKQLDGLAEPLFTRLEETTAWPDGVLPLDDGSILFYMVKAYRQSPFAWHVGAVGLGRVEPGTTDGTRITETLWDENSGFGSRVAGAGSPIRDGDDLLVYIRTDDGRILLARTPIAAASDPGAYTYWTGADWSAQPGDATPIWDAEGDGVLPADNGVHVTFDERLGKWIAVYNAALAGVSVRTADDPWGPWSEPVTWFDCRPFVMDRYPYCYSAQVHRHLAKDGGATQYMTLSSQEPYDVTLVELRMGAPVHEWRDAAGTRRYAFNSPSEDWSDAGIAFYASNAPGAGLSPVYEQPQGDEYAYTLDGDGQPVFYAISTSSTEPVRTIAIRSVDGALTAGGEDGRAAFHVPCAAVPSGTAGCE